jgi:hypothetical protein
MLLVQKYLETHSFGDLAKEHGVYASFSKSGHKFSLNYDQIEARESDPLSQECRGLILALADGCPIFGERMDDGKLNRNNIIPGPTQILAFPMKRFFNYGQGAAANINWQDSGLSILEKLDGTLTILYFDTIVSQWHVATRAVPEANLPIDNGFYTFRTLFEKALQDTTGLSFDQFTSQLDKSITYCFELTTPLNRIVVKYDNYKITLLAARSLHSLHELDITKLPVVGVPYVHAHTLADINHILDWVSSQNPLEHEGVVIRDSNFNRLKVKNASYVAFNKARDLLGTSNRNCLELVLAEKDDDVIPALPQEIVDNLLEIKVGVQNLLVAYDTAYQQILKEVNNINPGDKKTFAILVNKNKIIWSAPMFQIFDGKASNMKDFILRSKKDGTWNNSFLDKILEIIKK